MTLGGQREFSILVVVNEVIDLRHKCQKESD